MISMRPEKLSRASLGSVALWFCIFTAAGSETAFSQLRWKPLSQPTGGDPVVSIAVSPTGTVFAGTVSSGVLRSTTGGVDWTTVNNGFQFPTNQIAGMGINGSGHVFVLKSSDWMYKSTSEGTTWERDTVGLKSWMGSALIRRRDGTLFAGFNNRLTDRNTGGVYRSVNEGGSWVQMDTSFMTGLKTGFRLKDVAVKGPSLVFVAIQDSGVGVFVSTNNGVTWTPAHSGMTASTQARSLAVTISGTVLCGTFSEGVYRSTNDGAGWALSNTGLSASDISAFTVTRFGLIYAATSSGIFLSDDDGKSWRWIGSGVTDGYISSIAVDSSQYLLVGSLNGKMFRTTSAALILEPALTAPADMAANLPSPVTLSWNTVANADGYSVEVSTDSTFASVTVSVPYQTATTYSYAAPSAGVRYYWRVRGTWGGQFGPASQVRSFTSLGPLPGAPTLAAPADSATWVQIPTTFTWNPAADAATYRIQIGLSPSTIGNIVNQSGLTGTSWGPTSVLGYGTRYFWRVLAENPAGSTASATRTFTTRGGSIAAPVPSSPTDGANGVPLPGVVSWYPVAAATSYRVRISMEQFLVDVILDTLGIQGSSFTFPRLGPSTKYYWQVASESDTLPGAWWSAIWSFTTTPGVPLSPLHKLPLNGEENVSATSPMFTWTPPGMVSSYGLQIALDSSFSSIVLDYANLPYASYSPPSTPLATGTKYYWRVNAKNGIGTGPWSPPWSFTTAGVALTAPTLLGPVNGVRNLVAPVTYNWTPVSGATAYTVQVATDSLFVSSVSALGLTGVSGPPASATSTPTAGTVYYWRVCATNGAAPGPWSSAWTFATVNGFTFPTLTTPAQGGVALAPSATFAWSSVPNATAYHWQLSTDPGYAPLTSENTGLPSPSHTYSSLVSGTAYYWRVRAGNGSSWGPWSNSSTFTAVPAYPSSYTVSVNLPFPSKSKPSDFTASDYVLFGLPGNSGTKIGSFLSGTPEANWRVSWDNGDPANWIIRFDGTSTFNCSAGRGFWVLNNGPVNINTSVTTVVLNPKLEAEIPLHSGWNIIVNPFRSTLSWSSVQTANTITLPLYKWIGGSFTTSVSMDPYIGYYFYNAPNLTLLKMPYAGLYKSAVVSADPVDWRVTIALTTGEHTERATSFAVASVDEPTVLNFRKPRFVEGFPSVWFDRPEWDPRFPTFATDVRSTGAPVTSWDFTVRAPRGVPARLTFEGLKRIPSGLAVRLLDRQRLSACDLAQDSMYVYVPALREEQFTVLVGTPEEVQTAAESIMPTRFALLNPFPNPFNPAVTIPVDLARTAEITLTVHDILGARVRTLHAGPASQGRGWFVWDGKDEAGRTVASGTYLVILRGTNVPQLATRVVFVR